MPIPQRMSQASLQKYLDDAKVSLGSMYNPDELIQDLYDNNVQIEGLNDPPKSQGFFSRLKESIVSTPERIQRGFGSETVREGRQETSKGFDLADLPGDIADIIGPALPIAGAIGGGIIGAGVGIPTGPGAIAMGVAGAAAGGGVLEAGRRTVGNLLNVEERFGGTEKTPFEDIKGIAGEAAKSGAGELIGGQLIARPLAAVGGKLLRPFARYFDKDLAQIASRAEIDLPASSVVDSPIVQLTEQVTGKGIFGGKLKELVNTAERKISEMADSIVRSFGASDDLTLAGKSIDEGLQSYRSAWQKVKGKMYQQATDAIPATNRPMTTNTKEALEQVLPKKEMAEKVMGKTADSILRNILNSISQRGLKQPSLEELIAVSDELGELINFSGRDVQKTGSDAVLRKIAAAIDQDIMSHLKEFAPDAYKAVSRADEFYAKGIQSLNSALGKTIKSLSDEPAKIADRAIRPNSPEQASRVIEMVISTEGGAGRVANIQASFVRKLIDDATKQGVRALQGEALGNILNKYGDDTLDAVLGQDSRIALREVSKLAGALGRARNIAEGSQTAFLGKVQAMVVAIATGNIPIAAQIAGGDAVLSKIFQSQIGRKWLTEGLTSPTIVQMFAPAGVIGSKIVGRESSEIISEALSN